MANPARSSTTEVGETTLRKVKPYHSVRARRSGGEYHDRTDCPAGRQLHSQELAVGTGGLPRCGQCRALDDERPVAPGSV